MTLSVVQGCGQDESGHPGCMVLLALNLRDKLGRKFGGAVLALGEKTVREVGFDVAEVVSERCERAVVRLVEEQVELSAMKLESINLAMLKFERTDDGLGSVKVAGSSSEARVGAEGAIRLEPLLERACGDLNVGLPTRYALGVGEGVAEVES